MEKYALNKKQFAWFCAGIVLCILMNYFGAKLANDYKLPIWLDSAGTVLAAYLGGPVVGALVGMTGNFIAYFAYGDKWIYCIVSIGIGVLVGLEARKKSFSSLLNILTVAMKLTLIATILALPLNIIFGNKSTGNMWGDAVSGYLSEQGLPSVMTLPLGQIYVELLDKVLILLALYAILKIKDRWEKCRAKRHGTPEDTGEDGSGSGGPGTAARITAVLLAAGLCLSGTAVRARADTSESLSVLSYNDYVQTIYSSQNGLPCGEANDIAQTNDGILWIGTYAGLYRYNGREFRWMDNYESVRNVNCLYVDEEGRLWIGTNDNGLTIVINEQVANVIDQSMGLPANSVRSIIRSSDGYYYIGTTSSMQVLTLNYGLQRVNTLTEVLSAVNSAADDNGRVAAVSSAGVLYLISKGQILSSRRLTEGKTVFKSCAFDPEGYLLAATNGSEIYRFDVSHDWFEEVDVWECEGLTSIKDLTYLDSGILFISADNGVGYRTQDGQFTRINTNDFNNSIDNMLADYQGNLWFTSSRLGLLRLAPSDFRDIYSTAGLDNRVVNTIVNWNGVYYFGTDKGLDAVDATCRNRVRNELTEQLEGTRIRCMMVSSDNHLWICTYDSGDGLIEVEPDGTQYFYNSTNGMTGNRSRVVKELSDGTVFAGSDTGIAFIRDHEIQSVIAYEQGKITSMILTVTEMPDGTILAGTDGNGIAVLEDRKVARMLTRNDGLSSEVILRTVLDEKTGGVFVVTSNGLCYIDADGTVRTLDNFPYYNNYDVWIEGTDDLFVLSSAGIYLMDRTELLSGKEDIRYDLLDNRRGLNSSLTANSWTWYDEGTGDLFLACDTGVFVVNPAGLAGGTKTYRMSIPYAMLDGKYHRVDRNTPIVVSRGTRKLELAAEVINYTIQDPYVGFRMEGVEEEWVIVSQNSLASIVYTNLPAGTYTFHLGVFESDKEEQPLAERTYTIVKEKELFDNSWFILYILSVPMLTVGWVTWLNVRRREERMQKELDEANRQVEMGKQTVIAIARAVDAKDRRTGGHSRRVALYSKKIAESCHLSKKDCQDIEWAANMHDIGKIAIPDRILNKDSRLTDDEYAVMKSHTTEGAEILSDFTLLDHVIEGAEYHHERYDGRGYPKGLKGDNIPLYARIIGVADAFDAMTATRVYRKQMDFSYVLSELEKGRGTQFDPQFVDALLELIRSGEIDLNKVYSSGNEDEEGKEPKPETEKPAEELKPEAEKAPEEPKPDAEKTPEEQKHEPESAGQQQPGDAEGGEANKR